jgi:hypothetical protein
MQILKIDEIKSAKGETIIYLVELIYSIEADLPEKTARGTKISK